MGNIYNFLKSVFQDLKNQNSENSLFLLVLLLLTTIPFPNFVNNIFLGLFLIFSIKNYKKENYSISTSLFLPILLFALMALSYFWSIDKNATLEAVPKEITLFLIPLAFAFNQTFFESQTNKIKKYYSYSMAVLALFFLTRALFRYFLTNDVRVFFYHGENDLDYGLVPKLLNAIHVSVFVAIGFFYFISKEIKSKFDYCASALLFGFILLLSSKNIIIIVILLSLLHFFYFSKSSHKLRLRNLIVFVILVALIFSFGRIKNRFLSEFQENSSESISTNVIEGIPNGVHFVSVKEAWQNKTFTPNDYFPGTAFRVYQFRIFTELFSENNVFFTGFGLNASYPKIEEKATQYNLYKGNNDETGYQNKNFHNQYIQVFAELGVFGFIILIIILLINLKNAFKTKDFVHFAFAILMISLFLTESFLWRQRGVVFFTLFYCLFNSNVSKKIE
ncbi:MAG: O-antigen ligase family protein [Flavobacterium sp.]|uniref:O-antigen ligase family protein n=1 Tax=Flavobacterium sp. TaxID=239 RepID=UPI003528C5D0